MIKTGTMVIGGRKANEITIDRTIPVTTTIRASPAGSFL